MMSTRTPMGRMEQEMEGYNQPGHTLTKKKSVAINTMRSNKSEIFEVPF